MYNPGDDMDLDRLSSDAAEGFDAPGNPDWESMQAKLDELLPVEKKRRFLIFWWLIPVVIAGSIGIMYNSGKHNAIKPTTLAAPISASNKLNTKEARNPITETLQKEVDQSGNLETNSSPRFKLTNHEKTNFERDSIKKNLSGNPTLSSEALQNQASIENSTVPEVNEVKDSQPEMPVSVNKNETEVAKDQKDSSVNKDISKENIPTNTTTISKKRKSTKPWSIGILAGIDKSNVKFVYDHSPGYNIGIMAGYHFSDNISIHTGAIYTQKNYKVAGGDFTAPKGSWISQYTIETVDGYCRMWDIPLLFRYTFNTKSNHTFFLSTGMSSYFMSRENYNYDFYYNGQPTIKNYSYRSSDTHVLSIANISAGFASRVNDHLLLEVEPYAKIPMGGVGLGNIKLSSFGVNFSLQLRQPVKK